MEQETWNGNQGTLSVYVSKAKDLPNLAKLDKQNVLLRLRVAHMTRESDILPRAGQTPVFNYLERFEITPDVKPMMYVEVYCDRKKKAPLPIGRCEVDLLNGIRADPKEGYCTWYELRRDKNEFAGMIFIELTFETKIAQIKSQRHTQKRDRMDASIAARPIPPLPNQSEDSGLESQLPLPPRGSFFPSSRSSSPMRYTHASAMRQATPSLHNSNIIVPETLGQSGSNFNSSVNSNGTDITHHSETSLETVASDTKFHFANLKKLKEKINVFKNPSNSVETGQSLESQVDIEALQKAIGVASLSSDEDNTDTLDWRDSTSSKKGQNNPTLPVLPDTPPIPHLPTTSRRTSELPPMVPELPKSPRKSKSPIRRPPPII